jgi:hypothetical protein
MVVALFMAGVDRLSLEYRSSSLVPSHLVAIRVFNIESAYHGGSRLDFGYIDRGHAVPGL